MENNIESIQDIKVLINNEAQRALENANKKLTQKAPIKRIKITRKIREKIIVTQKICNQCHIEKPIEKFRKQAKARDGHKNNCADCDDIYQKTRYINKKDKILNDVKIWQLNNKEKVSNYKKKYRTSHKIINKNNNLNLSS